MLPAVLDVGKATFGVPCTDVVPLLQGRCIRMNRMQKRFMKTYLGLLGLIYKARLDRRGLYLLVCRRRLRGDLGEVYKI